MAKKDIKKEVQELPKKPKYLLEQILKSKKYSVIEKDIIKALCHQGEEYCLDDVENIIKNFKKGKV